MWDGNFEEQIGVREDGRYAARHDPSLRAALPVKNDPAANGSLSELAAMQPDAPGVELVRLADLARTSDTTDEEGAEPAIENGMEQNDTERNVTAPICLPKLPEKPGEATSGSIDRDAALHGKLLANRSADRATITPRQHAAIAKLVCGRTLNSAAAELGISRTTLYRWRQEEAFSKELARVCEDATETAAVRARNLMLKATRTLNDTLNGHDRFAWALKLVNSQRLWSMGQQRPRVHAEEEAKDDVSWRASVL